MKQTNTLFKLFSIVLFIGTSILSSAQNSMPIDKATGKVTYSGDVEVPGKSKVDLTDDIAFFISRYTPIRGTVNAILVNNEKSRISGTINLFATANAKSMQWFVNAAFRIDIKENGYHYEITDLYAYVSTVSNMYGNQVEDSPIEESDGFNVLDLDKKNDNAKNVHADILNILENLEKNMKK